MGKLFVPLLLVLGTVLAFGCTPSPRFTSTPVASEQTSSTPVLNSSVRVGQSFTGIASYYGPKFHGKYTANGETFDMYGITAAHKTLPFNTIIRVINLENEESTLVRINDRGPFIEGRILDLSYGAARKLGMVTAGTGKVRIEIIELGDNEYAR